MSDGLSNGYFYIIFFIFNWRETSTNTFHGMHWKIPVNNNKQLRNQKNCKFPNSASKHHIVSRGSKLFQITRIFLIVPGWNKMAAALPVYSKMKDSSPNLEDRKKGALKIRLDSPEKVPVNKSRVCVFSIFTVTIIWISFNFDTSTSLAVIFYLM